MNRILRNGGTWFKRNGSNGSDVAGILTPWTPSVITTAIWFDAADSTTITLGAGGISQWNDKSGNTRNATQSVGADRPQYITAGINNLNVVRCTASGNGQTLGYNGSFFANTSYTVYAVVSRRSNKSTNFFMGGSGTSANTNLIAGWESNTLFRFAQYANDLDYAVSGYSTPTTEMWGLGLNSSVGRTIWLNGTSVSTNATTTQLSSYSGAALGIGISVFGVTYAYTGDICEIVATTTVLSTSDRETLEGYLAWKWGTQASLPANHPYKNAKPYLN